MVKLKGCKKALTDARWDHFYGQYGWYCSIFVDRDTGDVWTIQHYNCNDSIRYHDPAIKNITADVYYALYNFDPDSGLMVKGRYWEELKVLKKVASKAIKKYQEE